MSKTKNISDFVKKSRKKAAITQPELSKIAGVGIRFLKELESGKETMRIDKINKVLIIFGHKLGPVPLNETNS